LIPQFLSATCIRAGCALFEKLTQLFAAKTSNLPHSSKALENIVLHMSAPFNAFKSICCWRRREEKELAAPFSSVARGPKQDKGWNEQTCWRQDSIILPSLSIRNVERIRDVVPLRLAGAAPGSGHQAESVRRSSAIGAYRLRCDTVGGVG